ncbi:hypothetical protein PSPO01_10048 [Paraphaeosphaeria sporulosa]
MSDRGGSLWVWRLSEAVELAQAQACGCNGVRERLGERAAHDATGAACLRPADGGVCSYCGRAVNTKRVGAGGQLGWVTDKERQARRRVWKARWRGIVEGAKERLQGMEGLRGRNAGLSGDKERTANGTVALLAIAMLALSGSPFPARFVWGANQGRSPGDPVFEARPHHAMYGNPLACSSWSAFALLWGVREIDCASSPPRVLDHHETPADLTIAHLRPLHMHYHLYFLYPHRAVRRCILLRALLGGTGGSGKLCDTDQLCATFHV